jgi:hypothetical protein
MRRGRRAENARIADSRSRNGQKFSLLINGMIMQLQQMNPDAD